MFRALNRLCLANTSPTTTPYLKKLSSFPLIMSVSSGAEGAAAAAQVVVVRHVEGEERFTFSFLLKRPDLKIEKQFNMSRPLNEPSSQFLERLNANVDKVFQKKNKQKRRKQDEEEAKAPDHATFTGAEFGDHEIKDVLFGAASKDITMEVLGQKFSIDFNPPLVTELKLQDQIMAGFMVYPYKISLQFADLDSSTFEWFVNDQKAQKVDLSKAIWVKKGRGFSFVPSTEDIDKHIKVVCSPMSSEGRTGIKSEVISKSPVAAGPGTCPFENRHAFTKDLTGPGEIRMVTYNLLADLYADSDFSRTVLHPQCPPYALEIDYRKQLFVKEILGYNADVVCLQEVDRKVFEGDLKPVMSANGMEGKFCVKGGQVAEGLATFWRKSKFSMECSRRVVLSESLENNPAMNDIKEKTSAKAELWESIVARPTALQIVTLRSAEDPGKVVILGTTHLYFKPDADHIRLIQVAICAKELEEEMSRVKGSDPEAEVGVFLSGDFNSTPPFGVLQFMRSRHIDSDHADWRSCPGEEVEGLRIEHRLGHMDTACGTPKYTNFTTGFADCLDYIFYPTEVFSVKEVIPFPSEEELKMHTAIPNVVFPSDHIACVVDLKWKEAR